jgi:diguanylate cyclase (GGDEF)-like protein
MKRLPLFFNVFLWPARLCFSNRIPESALVAENSKKPDFFRGILAIADRIIEQSLIVWASRLPNIAEALLYDKKSDRNLPLTELVLGQVRARFESYLEKDIVNLRLLIDQADPSRRPEVIQALNRHLENMITEFTESACENAHFLFSGKTDDLTQLPNRQAFRERLAFEIERHASHIPLAMAVVDLDHFKRVNDTYGHDVGDQVLRETALRIRGALKERGAVRAPDFVGRYGGEEFVVIYPDTPVEGACIGAHRIRESIVSKSFRTEISGKERGLSLSASIGVSEYQGKTADPDGKAMFTQADANLYVAKGQSPDRDGVIQDRRGSVSFGKRIVSQEEALKGFWSKFPKGWTRNRKGD